MDLKLFFLSPIFVKEFPVILLAADFSWHRSKFIDQKFQLLWVVLDNFLSLFFLFDFMAFMPPEEGAVSADALFASQASQLVNWLMLLTYSDWLL